MGKGLLILAVLLGLLIYAGRERAEQSPAAVEDRHAGLRGACRLFIERRELEAQGALWSDMETWQVVDNDDGSFSVGVRYAVAGRTRYSTCIIVRMGGDLRLQRLVRLQ